MCVLFYLLPRTRASPFFFFNDTATTEIYTLSLHDALPILMIACAPARRDTWAREAATAFRAGPRHAARGPHAEPWQDRKSTRLNSSHSQISYAVFCLKKKKKPQEPTHSRHRARLAPLAAAD